MRSNAWLFVVERISLARSPLLRIAPRVTVAGGRSEGLPSTWLPILINRWHLRCSFP